MAGRPTQQLMNAAIEERGGAEWVFDQISDGVPIGRIAEELGCSRRLLYRWRDQEGFEERRRFWEEAIRLSAEAHAELGMEELDKGALTSAQAALQNYRAKYRQWYASKRDPLGFGESRGASRGGTNILNFGELHLRTLQHGSRPEDQHHIVEATVEYIEDAEGDPEYLSGGESQAPEPQALPAPASPEDDLGELFE